MTFNTTAKDINGMNNSEIDSNYRSLLGPFTYEQSLDVDNISISEKRSFLKQHVTNRLLENIRNHSSIKATR